MKRYLLLLLCFYGLICGAQQKTFKPSVNLILDTDMGPDYDDVGAMAVMFALADSNQVNVLALLSSNRHELAVPCIEVISNYFNYPNIPIGAPKIDAPSLTTWHKDNKWTDYLSANYKHKTAKTSDAADAISVYRKVLSRQPDGSVTICTIGFLTNLKLLLDSKPDKYSQLTGLELVRKKVKLLVSMAGEFPVSDGEFNVKSDASSASRVVGLWPSKIIFSGFEIGRDILTGKKTGQLDVKNSPIRDVYKMSLAQDNPEGRNSWDQTAVLVAIKGYKPYYTLKYGTIIVDEITGANRWQDDDKGNHAYLVKSMSDRQVASIIENYMQHQPVRK